MSLFKRAKIVPKANRPTPDKTLTPAQERQLAVARIALSMITRRWFNDILSIEANRILPAILLAIYEAELLGRKISRRQACQPLGIDPTKTGTRYITMAEEHGLLTVENRTAAAARSDALRLTKMGRELIDDELTSIATNVLDPFFVERRTTPTQGRVDPRIKQSLTPNPQDPYTQFVADLVHHEDYEINVDRTDIKILKPGRDLMYLLRDKYLPNFNAAYFSVTKFIARLIDDLAIKHALGPARKHPPMSLSREPKKIANQ